MSLKNLFDTLKTEGLIKRIDQYLITSYREDDNRRVDINSPSSALGCVRASYYAKTGVTKASPSPRLRRIFDNGHKVHKRLQKYLREMEVLVLDEAPLFNKKYKIQGHTDGIIKLTERELAILEIKSMNTRQFAELKAPHREHRAQSQIYLFCVEEHRKYLKEAYKTKEKMEKDTPNRVKFYRSLYQHLQDSEEATREEKIKKKVEEHLMLDDVIYNTKLPITKTVVLYEDKNTQEFKEFVVETDKEILAEALSLFTKSNTYILLDVCPPRECKSKPRNCDFADVCFR